MPKIKITEIDSTGYRLEATDNIVYFPVLVEEAFEPILCATVKELNGLYLGSEKQEYLMIKELLKLGMFVLVEGIEENGSINWKKLEDKNAYNIRFLSTGLNFTPSKDMVECAIHRGDCVALLDETISKFNFDSDSTNNVDVEDNMVAAVRAFFETLHVDNIIDKNNNTILSDSYAAAFTPWFVHKTCGIVPASFGYLLAYAQAVTFNPEWYAAAGSFRGVINGIANVTYKYTKAECEVLQGRSSTKEVELDDENDNNGFAINPIAYVRPFGYIVWGNRTMLAPENDGLNTVLKASAFLNIRNLANSVKKALYEAANKYTFEQNSEVLWVNFKSEVAPLLDRMQSGNGILGYKFIRIKTDKKARLKARLIIIPIEPVEDFELEVFLADSLEISE